MSRTTEADIEIYLVQQVAKIGGKAYKGNPAGQRGFVDRICMFPGGWVVFVEVKRPGRKPRPNQRLMITKFKRLGFQAVWLDTRAKIDRLIQWQLDYQRTHKVFDIEHACIRTDCIMRRTK